jgi:hypothetical protein
MFGLVTSFLASQPLCVRLAWNTPHVTHLFTIVFHPCSTSVLAAPFLASQPLCIRLAWNDPHVTSQFAIAFHPCSWSVLVALHVLPPCAILPFHHFSPSMQVAHIQTSAPFVFLFQKVHLPNFTYNTCPLFFVHALWYVERKNPWRQLQNKLALHDYAIHYFSMSNILQQWFASKFSFVNVPSPSKISPIVIFSTIILDIGYVSVPLPYTRMAPFQIPPWDAPCMKCSISRTAVCNHLAPMQFVCFGRFACTTSSHHLVIRSLLVLHACHTCLTYCTFHIPPPNSTCQILYISAHSTLATYSLHPLDIIFSQNIIR